MSDPLVIDGQLAVAADGTIATPECPDCHCGGPPTGPFADVCCNDVIGYLAAHPVFYELMIDMAYTFFSQRPPRAPSSGSSTANGSDSSGQKCKSLVLQAPQPDALATVVGKAEYEGGPDEGIEVSVGIEGDSVYARFKIGPGGTTVIYVTFDPDLVTWTNNSTVTVLESVEGYPTDIRIDVDIEWEWRFPLSGSGVWVRRRTAMGTARFRAFTTTGVPAFYPCEDIDP